jgi:hypothetical protein
VKAIETIAEEKSANFDTLIKDIRKGTDFVTVIVWEWTKHATRPLRFPHVHRIFMLDAYQLAQLRDCYWLNTPPGDLDGGRQGFDLCFGVNCSRKNFNKEEGNYGKLMRIFDPTFERFLPAEVRKGTTLTKYFEMVAETIRIGLEVVGAELAESLLQSKPGKTSLLTNALPVTYLVERGPNRILIVGGQNMPAKADGLRLMTTHNAQAAIALNGKFAWKYVDRRWDEVQSGRKPSQARAYLATI